MVTLFTKGGQIEGPEEFSRFWQGMESPILCGRFLSKVGRFCMDVSRDPYKMAKQLKLSIESLATFLTCLINTAYLLESLYDVDITVVDYVNMLAEIKKYRGESNSSQRIFDDPRIGKLLKVLEKKQGNSTIAKNDRNLGIPLIGECTAIVSQSLFSLSIFYLHSL